MKEKILLVDNCRGRYIATSFVEMYQDSTEPKLTQEDIETLSDPDNEDYDETWCSVMDNHKVVDVNGNKYNIMYGECGDLFAVHTEWEGDV